MNANVQNQAVNVLSNWADNNLFHEMVDSLPYPVTIYKPDGYLAFVNKSWATMFRVREKESLIDKYNVLHDPDMKRWGHLGTILKAYQGNATALEDVKVPLQEMVDKYGDRRQCSEILFQTICCYPFYINQDKTPHVAVIYINTQRIFGREAVLNAMEYMNKHWMEKFDINQIASSVYVSRYYFTRIFKKDTGMTPYEYYHDIKIKKVMEKLREKNITVSDAFAICGLVYTGSAATRFRKKVGMTPSQYRNHATQK